MGVSSYADLILHKGHRFECVIYGDQNDNVALECMTCNEVVIDYNKENGNEEVPDDNHHDDGCM